MKMCLTLKQAALNYITVQLTMLLAVSYFQSDNLLIPILSLLASFHRVGEQGIRCRAVMLDLWSLKDTLNGGTLIPKFFPYLAQFTE